LGAAERASGSSARRLWLALPALVLIGGFVLAGSAYRERQRLGALAAEDLLAEAVAALGTEPSDPRRAVDRLLLAARRAGEREDAAQRDQAIELLDRIDHPYLIEALVTLLEDPDPRMRQLAAQTLGALRDAKASDPLLLCLGDADQAVFESALKALRSIHRRRPNLLINAYGADAGIVRQYRALALVDIVDPRLENALLEALVSEHPEVRVRAFHVAALRGAPAAAREVVERALRDPDDEIRQLAVKITGACGGARSLAVLLLQLHSEQSPSVRRELLEAIERAALSAPSDVLVAALQSEVPMVREAGARALARFHGDPAAMEGLVDLVATGLSREVDFETISQGGTRRTIQLQPDLRAALESLRELDRAAAVALLIERLAGGTIDERRGAALALEALADPAALEPLTVALADADPMLRLRAAAALALLDDARAIGPLVDAFAVSQSDDVELRETLHWALVRLTGSNYGRQPAPWIAWWARNEHLL
jgi:HEAT repeat protein